MLDYSDNTASRLGVGVWRTYYWITLGYGTLLMVMGLGIIEVLANLHSAAGPTISHYGQIAQSAARSPLLMLAGALVVIGVGAMHAWPVAGGWALRGGAILAFLYSAMSLVGHASSGHVVIALGWTLFYLTMPIALIWCPPVGPQRLGKALKRVAWVGWISVIAKLLVHLFVSLRESWLRLAAEGDLPRGELVRQAVRDQPVEALLLACAVALVIVVCRKGLTPSIGWLTFGLMLLTTFYLAPSVGRELILSGPRVLERVAYALLLLFGLLANAPAWLMPFAIVAAARSDAASPVNDLRAAG